MKKSTCINCSVTSCHFNEARLCNAAEITVGCNNASMPATSKETECVSFRIRQ